MHPYTRLLIGLTSVWLFIVGLEVRAAEETGIATASSSQPEFEAKGACDGFRFSANPRQAWRGEPGQRGWWWQIEFRTPRDIGAILQIQGDHPFVLTNAPARYSWQASEDGRRWHPLAEIKNETRLFRLHRLSRSHRVRFVRLRIDKVCGVYPTLREVEFYPDPQADVRFPPWIVAVNTTHDSRLPGHGKEFIPLAASCPGWEQLEAQQVWLGNFNEEFLKVEPRPLCAFLSGNFKDWCEVDRRWWRGTEQVLRNKNLPMWASCGGAQGLALLSEYGTGHPWDCPHCRDPQHPKTPIYGHIGHTGQRPCGDYSACVFERGPVMVRSLVLDPVFAGLPREFRVMESHCGQIEWPPKGWELTVTAGPDAKTQIQCLRLRGRYIYAAQFHIEMDGTRETSRQIMSNFLALAQSWGGYNPRGRPVLFAPR